MEITIKGTDKEIADFLFNTQNKQAEIQKLLVPPISVNCSCGDRQYKGGNGYSDPCRR